MESQEHKLHFARREKTIFIGDPQTLMRHGADSERACHSTGAFNDPWLELGQGKDHKCDQHKEKKIVSRFQRQCSFHILPVQCSILSLSQAEPESLPS